MRLNVRNGAQYFFFAIPISFDLRRKRSICAIILGWAVAVYSRIKKNHLGTFVSFYWNLGKIIPFINMTKYRIQHRTQQKQMSLMAREIYPLFIYSIFICNHQGFRDMEMDSIIRHTRSAKFTFYKWMTHVQNPNSLIHLKFLISFLTATSEQNK